ncbi:hypothetical protein RclHR1_11090002 [Rhizophagus clarus]|uniref:Uncharacterized protein n=1 Tax=Rhizophagus clarus TaxID=94130 RepID=A0A2Z6QIB2_9GLOM|nr:hypothetical protein RclHR1_11090002 [Rhizophagus clarus]GES79585.1 hypothetical protein GLOIN_2v1795101 [Rhizophagus clarus]
MVECRFFYLLQHDNNIYHVTCKKILLQGVENTVLLDDDYDYEFIFQSLNDPAIIFHVTCKLLSSSLIVNILNKKIYGMDFNVTNLECKLTLYQKLSLKQTLEHILPSFFLQYDLTSDNETGQNSDENFNSSSEENIIIATQLRSSMVDNQNMQSHLSTETLELNELELFYHEPDENHIYHVTCKMFSQHSENFDFSDDYYDYEFILDDSEMILHVTCKLFSRSLIVNILNKEVYGVNFDVTELKRKYLLTLHQKLNLEQNLKQVLPSYFLQHTNETRLYSHENLNSSHENIESGNIANDLDNIWPHSDRINSYQDINP